MAKFVETPPSPCQKYCPYSFQISNLPFGNYKLSLLYIITRYPTCLAPASLDQQLVKGDLFQYCKGFIVSNENNHGFVEQSFYSTPTKNSNVYTFQIHSNVFCSCSPNSPQVQIILCCFLVILCYQHTYSKREVQSWPRIWRQKWKSRQNACSLGAYILMGGGREPLLQHGPQALYALIVIWKYPIIFQC